MEAIGLGGYRGVFNTNLLSRYLHGEPKGVHEIYRSE